MRNATRKEQPAAITNQMASRDSPRWRAILPSAAAPRIAIAVQLRAFRSFFKGVFPARRIGLMSRGTMRARSANYYMGSHAIGAAHRLDANRVLGPESCASFSNRSGAATTSFRPNADIVRLLEKETAHNKCYARDDHWIIKPGINIAGGGHRRQSDQGQ